jgi:sugar phosphate isomerase/epimerase
LLSVGSDFDSDPHGTLEKVAAIGYKQVELSPLSKAPLSEIKKALADSGLKNPSGHYLLPDLLARLDEKIEAAKELGQEYMIVTLPWVADISRFQSKASNRMEMVRAILNGLTLEDWKWNADQFNKIGDQIKKAGLQLGYHNQNSDFRKIGESTGYDEFLRLTDPELVALELDCGWMTVAGLDPVTYLTKYTNRYRLLHIKDIKKRIHADHFLGRAWNTRSHRTGPRSNRLRANPPRSPKQHPRVICRARAAFQRNAGARSHQS